MVKETIAVFGAVPVRGMESKAGKQSWAKHLQVKLEGRQLG